MPRLTLGGRPAYDALPCLWLRRHHYVEGRAAFISHTFWVTAMAVPKRKHSNARTGSRRAHHALKPPKLEYCPQCSTAVPSHRICPNCGHYMGRAVVEITES
jgi:large subunit ribosomal protein L32